ncbi:MAG: glycosyltransferase family 2 protein [Flavobacteriales bacterium]
MTSEPLISVIIPSYNMAPWVERCVRSVLGQAHARLEVIAVNDRSTDDTGTLLDALAASDPRLKVLHLPVNLGLHAARRAGFEAAQADLIGFVDSDDHVPADLYALLAEALARTGADIALGGWRAVGEDGRAESEFTYSDEQVFTDDLPGRFARLEFSKGVVWNKLYRREIIAPAMAMKLDRAVDSGADYIIGLGNFMRARKVVTVPGATYFYVQRRASMSNGMDRAKAFAHLVRCHATAISQYAADGEQILAAVDESYRRQLRFSCYTMDNQSDLLPYRDELSQALARIAEVRPQAIYPLIHTFDRSTEADPVLPLRFHLGQIRISLGKVLTTLFKRTTQGR